MLKTLKFISLSFLFSLIFFACKHDAYESGDSSLSYLKAEMVDMHVLNDSVESIMTDADEQLLFKPGLKIAESMARPDTTYRMLLYYNKVEGEPITIKGNTLAGIFHVMKPMEMKTESMDPLTLTSVWQSANGKYINFNIGLKTGKSDDENAIQSLAIVNDSVRTLASGNKHYYYSLRHSQASIPEYYTVTCYCSLSISSLAKGDELDITIPTYNGTVTHSFIKK